MKILAGTIWPKRPNLRREVREECELHGVGALRGLLVRSTNGYSSTGRNTSIDFGCGIVARREEIQEWLKWKTAVNDLRVKTGVVAAIAAAVFSCLTLGLIRG